MGKDGTEGKPSLEAISLGSLWNELHLGGYPAQVKELDCHAPPSISQMPCHSHLWRHLPPCGSLQARTDLLRRLQICEPVASNLCRAGAWMYRPGKRIQVGYQPHLLQCSKNSFRECEDDTAVLFMLRISVNKAPSLLPSLPSTETLVS